MEPPVRIVGEPLRPEQVRAVADGAPFELEVPARVRESHELARRTAAERPLYGRSTGVGANRTEPVSDPDGFAQRLLRSHAITAGPVRDERRVRAMLTVRLNQLAAGGSGVSPELLDALAAMLATDALPVVREYGGVGTGDLGALATTALALQRERRFGAEDALAFLSSNAATIGDAALAADELDHLTGASVAVAALTFLAVDGNAEAYSPAVEQATPFTGARRICQTMRDLVAGAEAPARIQDPFGLRALPQVVGAALDRLDALADTVAASTAAPAENPVFLPDAPVAHHGGFHAAYLGQALDAARSAVAQSAQLATARLAMLCEPAITGLRPFLAGEEGSSGVMALEYVAASALAAMRAASAPAGVQSTVLSRGAEEDASFASLAAVQALGLGEPYRVVLACELVAALRALRQRGRDVPAWVDSDDLADAVARPEDRDLTDELARAADTVGGLDTLGRGRPRGSTNEHQPHGSTDGDR
jgi:histidine ammonia-lyase